MDLLEIADAITVHAVAAAAAVDSNFTDVAIGMPLPRARCVRIFYGGERDPEKMGAQRTLNSRLTAESILLRAFWPVSDYLAARGRALFGEQRSFVVQLRTRIEGDSQLGGKSADLSMHLAEPDDVVLGTTHYAIVDVEFVVDYHETTIGA